MKRPLASVDKRLSAEGKGGGGHGRQASMAAFGRTFIVEICVWGGSAPRKSKIIGNLIPPCGVESVSYET